MTDRAELQDAINEAIIEAEPGHTASLKLDYRRQYVISDHDTAANPNHRYALWIPGAIEIDLNHAEIIVEDDTSLFMVDGGALEEGPYKFNINRLFAKPWYGMDQAARGDTVIHLESEADAQHFRDGMFIMPRTGEISGYQSPSSSVDRPFCELVQVDKVFGRELWLNQPLQVDYEPMIYEPAHVSAGQPTPLGVHPAEFVLPRFGLYGPGWITQTVPSTRACMFGHEIFSLRVQGVTVEWQHHFQSLGAMKSCCTDNNIFLPAQKMCWALTADKGSQDNYWANNMIVGARPILHANEGCSVSVHDTLIEAQGWTYGAQDDHILQMEWGVHDSIYATIEVRGHFPGGALAYVRPNAKRNEIRDIDALDLVGTVGARIHAPDTETSAEEFQFNPDDPGQTFWMAE